MGRGGGGVKSELYLIGGSQQELSDWFLGFGVEVLELRLANLHLPNHAGEQALQSSIDNSRCRIVRYSTKKEIRKARA